MVDNPVGSWGAVHIGPLLKAIVINKGVVRSMIEKIRLCRNRGYARYIPPLKVRGLKRLIVVVSLIKRN